MFAFVNPVRSPRSQAKIYLYNQSSKKDFVIYYKIRSNAGQHFHVKLRFCTSNHGVIVALTFFMLTPYGRFARSLVTLELENIARSKVRDSLLAKMVYYFTNRAVIGDLDACVSAVSLREDKRQNLLAFIANGGTTLEVSNRCSTASAS